MEKIIVSKEEFQKNFVIGFCPKCIHFNDNEECEIEEIAKEETRNFARENNMEKADAEKMDCVMWECKYTTK